jgi:hypothetical protein
MRLEVYIARPPTRKCREVIAVMEEAVRRYPDHLELVVFERGAPWPQEPSRALKSALVKGAGVPLTYVGGKFLVGGRSPSIDEIEARVAHVVR